MSLNISNVSETLLIPFYARAYGSINYPHIFKDNCTLAAMGKIDYDFSPFNKAKLSIWGILSRTLIIDSELKTFLNNHPKSTIINIGCGFDTRFERFDNGQAHWYYLDFPNVINLRKKIFNTSNSRLNFISKNALDTTWLDSINTDSSNDVFIILEGILMFLEESQVRDLLNILYCNFPNAIVLTEILRPFTKKLQKHHDAIKHTNAKFAWAIQKAKDIENIHPKVKLLREWNLTKNMIQFSPFFMRLISPLIYRVNNSVVKLKFK